MNVLVKKICTLISLAGCTQGRGCGINQETDVSIAGDLRRRAGFAASPVCCRNRSGGAMVYWVDNQTPRP